MSPVAVVRGVVLAAGAILAAFSLPADAVQYTLSRNTSQGFKSTTVPSGDVATEAFAGTVACGKIMDETLSCLYPHQATDGTYCTVIDSLVSVTPTSANYALGQTGSVSCVFNHHAASAPQTQLQMTLVVDVVRGAGTCPAATAYGMVQRASPAAVGATACIAVGVAQCGVVLDHKYTFGIDGAGAPSVFEYWAFTGSTCATLAPVGGTISPLVDANPDPQSTENAVCKSGNPTACVSTDDKNCGWVNGSRYCVGASDLTSTNPCRQNANGSVFCLGTASSGVVPDNGTTNQPATPAASTTHSTSAGGSSVVNYYSSTQAANSTNYGDGPGGNVGAEEGGGEVCGAAPLPPCAVDVDETGTPTALSGQFDDSGLDGALGQLDSELASKGSVQGPNRSTIPALWSTSECQSITVNFFLGITREFPGSYCAAIDTIRDVLGWVLGIVVYWLLGRRVMAEI